MIGTASALTTAILTWKQLNLLRKVVAGALHQPPRRIFVDVSKLLPKKNIKSHVLDMDLSLDQSCTPCKTISALKQHILGSLNCQIAGDVSICIGTFHLSDDSKISILEHNDTIKLVWSDDLGLGKESAKTIVSFDKIS